MALLDPGISSDDKKGIEGAALLKLDNSCLRYTKITKHYFADAKCSGFDAETAVEVHNTAGHKLRLVKA